MKERDIQVKLKNTIQKYFKENTFMTMKNYAFEYKICKTKSWPISSLKEHQINALKLVGTKGVYYKIPDSGFSQKPFDAFWLQGTGYVVVAFYHPRKTKAYFLEIFELLDYMYVKNSNKKSLTEEEMFSVCSFYLDI